MSGDLVIVLKESRKGVPTPWLDRHRDRFSAAAKEASQELKSSKLKGADKVRAFNRLVAQKLRVQDSQGRE